MQTDHLTPKGSARLNSLCDVAGELFLDLGYEGVSMDALIARAGGSRRNIMAFGGKEVLFIASIQRLCADLAQPLQEIDISGPLRPALVRLAKALLVIALSPRVLALHRLMIAEGQRFPDLANAIRATGHERAVRLMAGWFAARGSELRANPPEILSEHFVNMLVTGPQLRALTGAAPAPTSVETAVDLFLLGALQGNPAHA